METAFSITALIISGLGLVISIASFRRSGRVERRSGHALIKAQVSNPNFEESSKGLTPIRIVNTGPAIAEGVRVFVRESEKDAETWGHDGAEHTTHVEDRLGVDDPKKVQAHGLPDDWSNVWVRWSDSAGDHEMNPDRPGTATITTAAQKSIKPSTG